MSVVINHPERVLGSGKHEGHEWIVTHNGIGARCGYVKVEPGHPWYGVNEYDIDCDVHGGITFAEPDFP